MDRNNLELLFSKFLVAGKKIPFQLKKEGNMLSQGQEFSKFLKKCTMYKFPKKPTEIW